MTFSRHIVITLLGSLGDLHPMIALGIALQARGHRVTIATVEVYRKKIEGEGLGFHLIRSNLAVEDDAIYQELFDPVFGPKILMQKYLIPMVRDMYDDLLPLLRSADFLVNSTLVLPGPVIAESLQLPWASVALQPMLYLSAYDPPLLPLLPALEKCHGLGPRFWGPLLWFFKRTARHWPDTVYALRRELGLSTRLSPLFEGQFSPVLNLAMFSTLLGKPQPDWPVNTHVSGFSFYDRMDDACDKFSSNNLSSLPKAVRDFLDAGEPPVVFALGSSAVRVAGGFYETAITTAKRMGFRAICITGANRPASQVSKDILLWEALPYSELFPYARAVVHQGGAGTTAQVLRAGKPMVMVPYAFDQLDNAARMKRLGVSQTIGRKQCDVRHMTHRLEQLFNQPSYQSQALVAAAHIKTENGSQTACELIEAQL
ncbi:MAG: glycosyltransferase [Vampirovibrionales bacterium]|nr:glycosyltransferase [Vampirovibrionales bacterium]